MSMSARDYVAIATVIRDMELPAFGTLFMSQLEDTRMELARSLADHFATTNPRFDRSRFILAATGRTEPNRR